MRSMLFAASCRLAPLPAAESHGEKAVVTIPPTIRMGGLRPATSNRLLLLLMRWPYGRPGEASVLRPHRVR
ncbi:hypothetical protein TSO221_00990 [Azospirillum sp. TSO22-1]|nr:hypothetical protein TSO221_00990 [Azospirillum sp. TSO22-1]